MPHTDTSSTNAAVAAHLGLPAQGVAAVLSLLDEGATVPFIARYRKERTGALDEEQIRAVRDRHRYLGELEARRAAIGAAIEEQGQLTPELEARLRACGTKAELEDLYLPFKKKRRTKATVAREQGLGPLAERILAQPPDGDPCREAEAFVRPDEVPDVDAALAGAREIVVEAVAEHADVRATVRRELSRQGVLRTEVAKERPTERTRFEDYYDHREPVARIPSHRYLAIRRGEEQGVLKVRVEVDTARLLPRLERLMGLVPRSPFAGELSAAVEGAWKRRLAPSVENDVRKQAKERADREAVQVFAENLQQVLLGAPYGARPVVGVDPGIRTGCKCAAVAGTGRFLGTCTVHPLRGRGEVDKAASRLVTFVREHEPEGVAVGSGTGGRRTLRFVQDALREAELTDVLVVRVDEAGASVYSASKVARAEFPDLDITVRGAISIARRLQDPLAELVKIEPRSIGVGQYQHDVHQPLLREQLAEVVESSVNRVGVELNTASASLLAHVAGVGPTLAKRIVSHREERGRFPGRRALLRVKGLGPKAFEQAAGFLRVRDGDHPLDASAVHPERYELVERIAKDLGTPLVDLVGDAERSARIEVGRYVDDEVGEPTLRDIVDELRKPGRDPRSRFEAPRFSEDVRTLEDLREGLVLEGVVTNVTNFGAFVDVGVHQDGLVHVSQLADRFVQHPRDVVAVGDRVQVRVLSVDLERKRISLSARSEADKPKEGRGGGRREAPRGGGKRRAEPARRRRPERKPERKPEGRRFSHSPFADLLKKK